MIFPKKGQTWSYRDRGRFFSLSMGLSSIGLVFFGLSHMVQTGEWLILAGGPSDSSVRFSFGGKPNDNTEADPDARTREGPTSKFWDALICGDHVGRFGGRSKVKQLSWTGVVLLSVVLILVAALTGALLAGLFPQASQIFLLPTGIAIGVIVSMAVKKNARK